MAIEFLESRRLLANGLDPTFGVGGIVMPQTDTGAATIDAMTAQGDSTFAALGHTSASNPQYLFLYDAATGETRTAHITDPRLANLVGEDPSHVGRGTGRFLAHQSTGKLILGGYTDASYIVARFNTDGTLDASFGSAGVATLPRPRAATTDPTLLNMAVRHDDRIVLMAVQYVKNNSDGLANLVAMRLTADGALDKSYDSDGVAMSPDSTQSFTLTPVAAALEGDGKIITAGENELVVDLNEHYVARYNADLTIDSSFGVNGVRGLLIGGVTPGGSNGGDLTDLAIQRDDKIIVGGRWSGGSELCRFNTDGSPDASFGESGVVQLGEETPPIAELATILPEAAGKMTVLLNNSELVRLHADGSLDSSFGTGGVSSLAPLAGVQAGLMSAVELGDGRIAVGAGDSVALAAPRQKLGLGANGTLFVTGTTSADTISITVVGTTVHAVRNGTEQTFPLANVKRIDIASDAGNDTISVSAPLPTSIQGEAGDDSITVTAPASGVGDLVSIYGGDGNDTLIGSAANDLIDAGAGDDSINAGAGDDKVTDSGGQLHVLLGAGNDSFSGNNAGPETRYIDAGDGNDFILTEGNGSQGPATIIAGAGDDRILASGTVAAIDAGDGNDTLSSGFASGTVLGGAGDDIISSPVGSVSISGGAGNDRIAAAGRTGETPTILGEDGQDTIYGGDENDSIIGGANKDIIRAGGGNDTIRGYGGNDQIFGQGGDDLIFGCAGNDRIDGGDGIDTIGGSDGDDSISGGANKDIIHGGSGNDTVHGDGGNDQIFGEAGDDSLSGNAGNDRIDGGDGNDSLWGDSGSNTLSGNAGDDMFWARNSTPDTLDGGTGTNRGSFDELLDTVTSVVPA